MEVEINQTKEQQIALNILPRIAAFISICCVLHIIVTVLRSKYYRNRMYHRIMLASGVHIIIHAMTLLWGTAALPVESSDTLGAAGNIATCSASGSLLHYSMFVAASYYSSLSILSVAAFLNKFNFSKFAWIEKWIHIGVYIFPVSSSAYLLSIDAFNPVSSGCTIASIPVGCGDQSSSNEELLCTRGPQNIGLIQLLLGGIPAMITLLVPVFIMVLLYFYVRSRGESAHAVAWSVVRQGGLYILILILTLIFLFVDIFLIFKLGKYSFVTNLLANVNEALIGMWILIAYQYFRSEDPSCQQDDNNTNEEVNAEYNHQTEGQCSGSSSGHELKGSIKRLSSSIKPEFSIFDGNSIPDESPWAEFLTEGEDEDYEKGRIWQQ